MTHRACRGCAGFEAPGRKIGLGAQRPKLLEPEPKHAILSTPLGQVIHARDGVDAPYSWDIGSPFPNRLGEAIVPADDPLSVLPHGFISYLNILHEDKFCRICY